MGQPFDIVKVVSTLFGDMIQSNISYQVKRMQTAPKGTYKGMVDCAGGILKNEGPLAFYKVSAMNEAHRLLLNFEYKREL